MYHLIKVMHAELHKQFLRIHDFNAKVRRAEAWGQLILIEYRPLAGVKAGCIHLSGGG